MNKKNLLILFVLFLVRTASAQDQIEFLNGDKEYVDIILAIENDSIVFKNFKKIKKLPLTEVKGYYSTINSKDNLRKSYYKRAREYYAVDSSYHQEFYSAQVVIQHDFINEYIQSCLPSNFSTIDYSDGYYITNNSDTIYTQISDLKDIEKNSAVFITKTDSQDYNIFTAQTVKAYSIKDKTYISYFPTEIEGQKIYLFIQQEIVGKINLFYKTALPYHDGSYYLVNKNNSDTFYHLCPYGQCLAKSVSGYQKLMIIGERNSGFVYMETNPNLDNSFKELMPKLVADCPGLVNRIKSEFYKKADIKVIVKEYNENCK